MGNSATHKLPSFFNSIIDMMQYQPSVIAFNFFQRSAEQGYPPAVTNLGICYENGEGCEKDITMAKKCFEESAERNNASANFFLGKYYLQQANISKKHEDYAEAARFFRTAIDLDADTREAYYYLGFLFQNGFGVDRDYKTALTYYK